jgi:putative phosphoribosyl transferase
MQQRSMLEGQGFRDRRDAGRQLADRLEPLRAADPVVVGLPRGGVVVAAEVARRLGAPLDVIVVRKLGLPFQPELGMGAVGEGGVRVLNDDVIRQARISPGELEEVERRERLEVERRAQRFRGGHPPTALAGRTVVVVDDGIATGGTMRAALQVVRAQGAARVVLAIPIGPADVRQTFSGLVDEIVCLSSPPRLVSVGQWYQDFSQTTDEEVSALLAEARGVSRRSPNGQGPVLDPEVEIAVGDAVLRAQLSVPAAPVGVVVFAHGSGSSRHSPRNRFVAERLNEHGLATVLVDLLTPSEEIDRRNVFDVELLARRLDGVTAWLREQPETSGIGVGYFGASTGAAAALIAASAASSPVRAVVSRGGRPDLAASRLGSVRAPTLLIVGSRDPDVLALNRDAARQLHCEHDLVIIPGATHLFEEHGALEAVSGLAQAWFIHHLGERGPEPAPPSVPPDRADSAARAPSPRGGAVAVHDNVDG